MKNSFIKGIIIGVILTFFGTYIQFKLQTKHNSVVEQKKMKIYVSNSIQVRKNRSANVLSSYKKESIFSERWASYIYQGYHQWNDNFPMIKAYVSIAYNDDEVARLDEINVEFNKLHNQLLVLQRYGSSETDKDNSAKKSLEILDKIINLSNNMVELNFN